MFNLKEKNRLNYVFAAYSIHKWYFLKILLEDRKIEKENFAKNRCCSVEKCLLIECKFKWKMLKILKELQLNG